MALILRILEIIPHLFICMVLIFLTLNYGAILLRQIIKKEISVVYLITTLILGFTVISYYYFFIGMLQLYKEPFLTVIPFAVGVAITFLNRVFIQNTVKIAKQHKKGLILGVFAFLVIVMFRAFPDIGFDSNWFHLSLPLFYLKNGGIYHVGGFIFPSGYPQFAEMLILPLIYLGNSITTSIFFLFIYFLLGIAVYKVLIGFEKDKTVALLAALAVFTTPINFSYANLAYVDILQALSFLMAFFWIQKYINEKKFKFIIVASLMLISVSTIKYSGGLICVSLVGYIFFSKIKCA